MEMNIRTFCERFLNGDFANKKRSVQIDAGWDEWDCPDKSLASKTGVLGRKIVEIADSKLFDNEGTYIFFYNSNGIPFFVAGFDSFSIASLKDYSVLFRCRHMRKIKGCKDSKPYWELNDLVSHKTIKGEWKDVRDYFMNTKK